MYHEGRRFNPPDPSWLNGNKVSLLFDELKTLMSQYWLFLSRVRFFVLTQTASGNPTQTELK